MKTKKCECGNPMSFSAKRCLDCYKKNAKGFKRTKETRRNVALAKLGAKNPMWKGDKVGYSALHIWVSSRKNKPKACERCRATKPRDLANISGEYKRDLDDWEWLCRRCHMLGDGRLKAFIVLSKKSKIKKRDSRGRIVSVKNPCKS